MNLDLNPSQPSCRLFWFYFLAAALGVCIPVSCRRGGTPDKPDINPDGLATISHYLAADDQPRPTGMNIAEGCQKLVLAHAGEVKTVCVKLYWPGTPYSTYCGNILLDEAEVQALKDKYGAGSTANYRMDYQNDYGVALYDACTPLALLLASNPTETKILLKHKRSKNYRTGIRGEPMPDSVQARGDLPELDEKSEELKGSAPKPDVLPAP